MTSVTRRIKQIGQPRGGYLNPRTLEAIQLGDAPGQLLDLKPEDVHPMAMGLAVDYLSRLANGAGPGDAFKISLRGAMQLHWTEVMMSLDLSRVIPVVDVDYLRGHDVVEEMRHLADALFRMEALRPGVVPDDDAIRAAVHLVGYDVAIRQGPGMYEGKHAVPNEIAAEHIRIMVERALNFFALYGPITADGFMPVDGLSKTELINSGDGDFLTADTLWDFKVSVAPPSKENTLQLLVYLLMGQRSASQQFDDITHLGLYNPRLNTVYRIALADIPAEVMEAVAVDVIGYDVAAR